MKLSQVVAQDMFLPPEWDRPVANIVADSRDVAPGDLFIARAGSIEHGEKYINDAIAHGASAVIAEGDQGFRCSPSRVPVFYIPEVARKLSLWLQRRYASVSSVKVIGVTGTNGKSSVTQYCAQVLELLGHKCAVIGTLGNGVWPDLKPTRNTTPDICLTYRLLNELALQGARYAALEVSSHGLDQGRVEGLRFNASALTNISQDHLDYHGDMENYFAAKSQLFRPDISESAVINIDDQYGRRLWNSGLHPHRAYSVGKSPDAMVRYSNVVFTEGGMTADLTSPWGAANLRLALMGEFNIANVVTAISLLAIQGFSLNELLGAITKLHAVEGRMELYVSPGKPQVVIDFAHTPDALSNVLAALSGEKRNITVVFGCGGDRDRSKRGLMAAAVESVTQVWVTDDNPRSENPEQIFDDIRASGVAGHYHFDHDRRRAIEAAVAATPASGVVLIAGKGHENYQEIAGVRHPYSDAESVRVIGYRKVGGDHAG